LLGRTDSDEKVVAETNVTAFLENAPLKLKGAQDEAYVA
jgi:hypothetical protein